jgi:hypothetical protein
MSTFTESAALQGAVAMQSKQTGIELSDFGDHSEFYPALRMIIEDINIDVPEPSKKAMYKILLRHLTYRLQINELMKQHADLLEKTDIPPIVYVGSMVRSGSTLFHNLLYHALDGNRALLKWEHISPMPLAQLGKVRKDPRIALTSPHLQENRFAPMHFVDAGDPEETCYFADDLWGLAGMSVKTLLPRYRAWVEDKDSARAAYRRLRKVIRLLMVLNPPAPGAQLVLKCPQEIMHLQVWSEEFPEAKVVLLHRDPYRVFDSGFHMGAMMFEDFKLPDPKETLQRNSQELAQGLQRDANALTNFEGWKASVLYEDLMKDPVGETLRCLKACGISADTSTSDRINNFVEMQRKRRKPIPKELSTKDHGRTVAKVRDQFVRYIEQFQIPHEKERKVDVQGPGWRSKL